MSQPLIDLQHISKSFDGEMVLDDLNLSIKENSFVNLNWVPAAAGKSTTLRNFRQVLPRLIRETLFLTVRTLPSLPPNKAPVKHCIPEIRSVPTYDLAENMLSA